jgi:hypothetical protein
MCLTIVGCIVGNFAYQWLTTQQYAVAAERTFFQLWALAGFALSLLLVQRMRP